MGFVPADIEKEEKRGAKLTCSYCKGKGATIGCCKQKCKKSFHLPCAIKSNCSFEFIGTFKTFCALHHATVNTSKKHSIDDVCAICSQKMNEYDVTKSIQMACCRNEDWYHKMCLKEMAIKMGRHFKCPSCSDLSEFQENMLYNGIYIPYDTQNEEEPTTSSHPSENDLSDVPKAKQRRIHKNWLFEKTFAGKLEAEDAVRSEKMWSRHYTNTSDAGKRVNYRCNLVKFRGKQCDAGIYLLFDSRSSNVSLFRNNLNHTHDSDSNAVFKFTDAEETLIKELFELSVKPKMIKYHLVQKGFSAPPESKFNSFMIGLRRQKYGSQKLHLGALEKWLKENSSPPADECAPFVLKFRIEKNDPEDLQFRLVRASDI